MKFVKQYKQYKILRSINSNTLTEDINTHLVDGWELYGYLNTPLYIGSDIMYIQVVTRLVDVTTDSDNTTKVIYG